MAAARRADARRRSPTWSTSATCPTRSPRTRRSALLERGAGRPGRTDRRAAPGRLPGLLDRRRAGSAIPTSGSRRCAPRPSADGFNQVKIKVGAALDGRQAPAARSPARRSGDGHRHRHRRQPGVGCADRDRLDRGSSRRSGRPGSRSRPARTTSSARPRSAGASRPVQVATGEHVANRVHVQAAAAGRQAIDVMQIDACRVAGVNENIANLLLAAKFGVPVCPHAGGVGLCEIVQHLSMFDYVALSGTPQGHDRVDRPPARALRGARRRVRRPLPRTGSAGRVHRDPAGVAGRVHLPGRCRVAG